MERISQLLLTFLLNACWQVVLITAVGALSAWLLRHAPARYRHLLWVATLVGCFCIPAVSSLQSASNQLSRSQPPPAAAQPKLSAAIELSSAAPAPAQPSTSVIPISGYWAAGLIALYGLFLCYRGVRFFNAWRQMRAIIRDTSPAEARGEAGAVIESCKTTLGVTRVNLLCSPALRVPITVGSRQPSIILPAALFEDAPVDVLTAAFGHELVHVLRRDYALNLLYELIALPLSFHPALRLVRRRIKQTRELRCDEVVAERLLDAQSYARSLVHLASSALPPCVRAESLTVGINDADILEVRIMSLLRKSRSRRSRNLWLLGAACVLLALPCVAAAAFALHFNVGQQNAALIAEVPSLVAQENQEKTGAAIKRREARTREEREMTEREMKERAERDPQFRAELEAREQHMRLEREARAQRQAELARLARVTMDQAIQTVTNQQPGKVLECTLNGEHWEAPGKIGKDGVIFYHVVVHSGDEANPTVTHFWVNAIDGNIIKTEKE
ncbi:MAG TPA: M56 family metallopeptidase [Blastocatellia bacterium]|nr:M56 family metallopeptidase [Blastocatellia bacterium]